MISRTSTFFDLGKGSVSLFVVFLCALLTVSCQRTAAPVYDILIVGGEVYDGSGNPPIKADVAISGDKIARIGQIDHSQARRIVDASGQGASMTARASVSTRASASFCIFATAPASIRPLAISRCA